jgi:hypothetical protein
LTCILRPVDYAAEQEEEVCALQAILMDDIEGAPPLSAPGLRSLG